MWRVCIWIAAVLPQPYLSWDFSNCLQDNFSSKNQPTFEINFPVTGQSSFLSFKHGWCVTCVNNSINSSHQWPSLSVQYSAVQAITYPSINFKFHSGSITGILRNQWGYVYKNFSAAMWGTGQFARQKEKLLLYWSLWPKGHLGTLHPFDSLPCSHSRMSLSLCSAISSQTTIPVQENRLHLRQSSAVTSPSWPSSEELFPGEKQHWPRRSCTRIPTVLWISNSKLQGSEAVWFLRNRF